MVLPTGYAALTESVGQHTGEFILLVDDRRYADLKTMHTSCMRLVVRRQPRGAITVRPGDPPHASKHGTLIQKKDDAMTCMPPGWSDAELAALGGIVANFAELEWCADQLPAGFIQPADVAILVTAGENIRWKLDKLSAIASEILADPQAKSTLLNWINTSLLLISRRNELIHSFDLAQDDDQQLMRMKATTRGGQWEAKSEPIDRTCLAQTADLLADGLNVADLLMQQLAADCPEWHDLAVPPEDRQDQAR
jgi:hypothetical protein